MLNLERVQKIPTSWQQALVNVIHEPEELFQLLELDTALLPQAKEAAKLFDLRVPRRFVAKMQKGNLQDPLLRQILPIAEECIEEKNYSADPLAEVQFNPIAGMLHKYHGRVLLTVTSACGINCRYCFRRHFPYAENNVGKQGRERILQYLRQDPSIQEVIYSGGDPLLAGDDYLQELTQQIFTIPHIKRLRIHSRLPVVLPERITKDFIDWFAQKDRQNILVLHCNHAQELDADIAKAVQELKLAGVTVLNQAVLLRGVNDDAQTQIELSEALFAHGILPYYLHLLDKVQGAAHFDVAYEKAQMLYKAMQAKLAGFLVPKLVREIPGAANKVFQL